MTEFFIAVVLGHFAGDYLLQSKKMALTKSEKGKSGLLQSLWHCLIYTSTVCIFAWNFTPLFAGLIFLSHWPIDRYSLATKWLKAIKGRDLIAAYESKDKYREFDVAFSSLVYAVVDNTLHIILMWLVVKFVS